MNLYATQKSQHPKTHQVCILFLLLFYTTQKSQHPKTSNLIVFWRFCFILIKKHNILKLKPQIIVCYFE